MILWLRERFNWMGSHSGYDQVCEAIAHVQPADYQSVWREPDQRLSKVQRRILTKLAKNAQVSPFYNASSTATELAALWHCFRHQPDLLHITYVENNLGILPRFKRPGGWKLVGTAHQPASWWRLIHPYPKSVCALDGLIVPASREVRYFEQFLPGRVHFVPHGIDTQFFCPRTLSDQPVEQTNAPRCVFSGTWLRDLQTLTHVIDRVLASNPAIQFDMVVPRIKRNDPFLHRIARHDQVFWHADVSDEQLRELYRQSSVFVLPLLDCTANNAVLEAMACGLPIISNDVGGLPDYTHSTFAQLLPIGDVDGFTNAILELTADWQTRQHMGAAARAFAQQNFSWERIAAQTLEVYQQVSQS